MSTSSAATPTYATKDEIAALREELKAALTTNYKGVQSKTDSFQSRVQTQLKGIQETLKGLQAVGVQVTPEQANAMRQQALFSAFEQEPPDGQPQPAPGQGQLQPPAGAGGEPLTPLQQQVTDNAVAIMQSFGIEIEDNDPEVAIIEKAQTGSPEDFYKAVREACQAKLTRLPAAAPQTLSAPVSPETTAARMPGLSSGGQGAANTIQNLHGDDLWNAAMKKR